MQNPSQQYFDGMREEYKSTRRLKTVKYVNNSIPKHENRTEHEVTYDKSTADKIVFDYKILSEVFITI